MRVSSSSNQGRRAAPERLAACLRRPSHAGRRFAVFDLPGARRPFAPRRQQQGEQGRLELDCAVQAREPVGGVALGVVIGQVYRAVGIGH